MFRTWWWNLVRFHTSNCITSIHDADVYVSAAYTETFAHPLVEAMASGIPVVASDIPVHREICADAAKYFPTFSAQALAQVTAQVLSQQIRRIA